MNDSDYDSKIQNLLEWIREQSSQGEYLYRGEPEQYDKISSTLYRMYAEKIDAEHFDILIAQQEMLEQVKGYTDFTDETDVLTELQHYGGKTNLIDFTTDYLIALFFACDGSLERDGRIILLNKKANQGKITSPKKNQNNRVISQKSIFCQSPKGYLEEEDSAVKIISIPQELKQTILHYLRTYHGIATHTIYNDIFGYIQNQKKHQTAYTEFYIGITSSKKGESEEAIAHFDQAISINPQFAEAYGNRGVAKQALGWHHEAITDYDEVTRINPQDALAYCNRGAAKHSLGLHSEAIADYDQAIRLNPEYADAYYNRGNTKAALGRHQEAITDYDLAVHINPQYAVTYYNRGNTKAALGRHQEAITDYDLAVHINPQYAQAYFNRGTTKVELGRHEEAIADFDQAIRINCQYAQAYENRGVAKGKLRRYEEAIADFDQAIRINPTLGQSYYNRGTANKEIGRYEEAHTDLLRALDLAKEEDNQALALTVRRKLEYLPPANGTD